MNRLRASGKVPAVLYGHRQDNVDLTLDLKQLKAVMQHSGHIVQLKGSVNEQALIKHVQWDEVLNSVVHVDLYRVDAKELLEIELTIELRGPAKGASQGGVVNHIIHDLTIMCPADRIPEKLELKIFDLELGQAMRAKDIALPEGARLVGSPEMVIVSCTRVMETEATAAAGAEPEVIGKKKPEDEKADKK
jgi:large subunit ribosomal protein L25